jgi:xylan 1,4-beta-xylosidase
MEFFMNFRFSILLSSLFFSFIVKANETVNFYQFTYQGEDDIFETPLKSGEFRNPILAGFYPDPSIVRVNDGYYLVNSSFAYSPGVPIFHSKDLINWQSLGHVLITPKQLPLEKQTSSRGIYAPTLRYHQGIFYLITTLVDIRGNFIVTAKNPAGPWSDPILLPEIGGIDPDLFFDDDGRVYIAHNDAPLGEPLYNGHRAIWLWEYDVKNQKVIKNSGRVIVNGGVDISKKPIWIEGPHIYKINGWYYLVCAEGGTGHDHSAVVFRSKSLNQPFIAYEGNPILTQHDLASDRTNPVTNAGHADLVQTKEGEWWAVFLASRPYEKNLFNTGRETFLLPVSWKNDWPVILEKGKAIPLQLTAPKTQNKTTTKPLTGNFIWTDSFEQKELNTEWLKLRQSNQEFFSLQKGILRMSAKNVRMDSIDQPAFLGRRQQHSQFIATTEMSLPANQTSAGIVAFQNEQHHYYFGVKNINNQLIIFVEQAKGNAPVIIHKEILDTNSKMDSITLEVKGNGASIDFSYQQGKTTKILLQNADARILSTEVAGGFIGTMIGLHARQE